MYKAMPRTEKKPDLYKSNLLQSGLHGGRTTQARSNKVLSLS